MCCIVAGRVAGNIGIITVAGIGYRLPCCYTRTGRVSGCGGERPTFQGISVLADWLGWDLQGEQPGQVDDEGVPQPCGNSKCEGFFGRMKTEIFLGGYTGEVVKIGESTRKFGIGA